MATVLPRAKIVFQLALRIRLLPLLRAVAAEVKPSG